MKYLKKVASIIAPFLLTASQASGYDYYAHLLDKPYECSGCFRYSDINKKSGKYFGWSHPGIGGFKCPKCAEIDYTEQIKDKVLEKLQEKYDDNDDIWSEGMTFSGLRELGVFKVKRPEWWPKLFILAKNKKVEDIKKEYECVVCKNQCNARNDTNALLCTQCGTRICADCAKEYYKKFGNKCPYCRQKNLTTRENTMNAEMTKKALIHLKKITDIIGSKKREDAYYENTYRNMQYLG